MSWTQYSAGVPYPILLNTSLDLPYVKGRTILATREHLDECHRKIHLNTTCIQHPQCKNDVLIMHLVNTQSNPKVNINQKEKSIVLECFQEYIMSVKSVQSMEPALYQEY